MSSILESTKVPSMTKADKEAAREKRLRVAILNMRLQTTKIYKQKAPEIVLEAKRKEMKARLALEKKIDDRRALLRAKEAELVLAQLEAGKMDEMVERETQILQQIASEANAFMENVKKVAPAVAVLRHSVKIEDNSDPEEMGRLCRDACEKLIRLEETLPVAKLKEFLRESAEIKRLVEEVKSLRVDISATKKEAEKAKRWADIQQHGEAVRERAKLDPFAFITDETGKWDSIGQQ